MNRLLGALMFALLATTARAGEPVAAIRDKAPLFSPEAVAKAEANLRTLAQKYQLDLVVETVSSLTPEEKRRYDQAEKGSAAFLTIARERAKAEHLHGVYIFISKIPKYETATVVVYPDDLHDTFTETDREHVRKALTKHGKSLDEKLLRAVDVLDEQLQAHQASGSWFGWGTVAIAVGAVVGAWLLIGLVRMSSPQNTDRPGFVPGLLGGLFGAVAGQWIYDSLVHTPRPTTDAPSGHPQPSQPIQ
jgi:TPM domain